MFNSRGLKSLIIVSLLTISSAAMAAEDTVDLSGTVEATLNVERNADRRCSEPRPLVWRAPDQGRGPPDEHQQRAGLLGGDVRTDF